MKVRYDSEFGECFEINPLKRRFSFKTAGGIHYHSRFSPSFQFKRNKDKEQNAPALCLMGAVPGVWMAKGQWFQCLAPDSRYPAPYPSRCPPRRDARLQRRSFAKPVTCNPCTVPAVVVRWWIMGGPHPQAQHPPLLVCFCSTVFWNWGAAMGGVAMAEPSCFF